MDLFKIVQTETYLGSLINKTSGVKEMLMLKM